MPKWGPAILFKNTGLAPGITYGLFQHTPQIGEKAGPRYHHSNGNPGLEPGFFFVCGNQLGTENPRVGGSIPPLATTQFSWLREIRAATTRRFECG